jgi:hypothetical protein
MPRRSHTVYAYDDGELVGGIVASTCGGWLAIDLMTVVSGC